MTVPHLPPLDPELVAEHERAHVDIATRYDIASPRVQRLFKLLQRRLAIEALAHVQPVTDALGAQPLAVPPRAYLTLEQERRMQGAAAAFRHIDARITMVRRGLAMRALISSTPVVLNALLQGPLSTERELNPGMLRGSSVAWNPAANPFVHPEASMCEALVEAAIDVANNAPAPACARAAWLTFAMLSVHPFVDGNGRTSRALYMTVAGEALPLGIDWGALEQWSIARAAYIESLQAGQRVVEYEPEAMDALPFMQFATTASIAGAALCGQRLDALATDVDFAIGEMGLSPDEADVIVAIRLLRIATMPELLELGVEEHQLAATLDGLLRRGVIRWSPRPFGRRTLENAEPYGLVV